MVKKLTQEMAKKLRNRRSLRPSDRADLDYKMVKKLQSGLDELAGLLYIMKALPPEKIIPKKDTANKGRKIGLKDRHVQLLFSLTKTALRILGYKKIRGDSNYSYILEEVNREKTGVNWQTGEPIKHGEFRRRNPLKEEKERAKLLWEHADYLKMLAPDFNPENPSDGGNSHGTNEMRIVECVDRQMKMDDEKKIRELLASGKKDIEQVAREVGRDSWDVRRAVYQIQENDRAIKRRTDQIKQEITNLEQDVAAIEQIKELWGKGWGDRLAIAAEINHSRNAVTHVIDKMIERGEIAKEELMWVWQ